MELLKTHEGSDSAPYEDFRIYGNCIAQANRNKWTVKWDDATAFPEADANQPIANLELCCSDHAMQACSQEKKRITATKRSSESCRMEAMGETPFLSRLTHRYWRTAQTNFSVDRNRAPEFWMIE